MAKAKAFLAGSRFDWAVCGGVALDLYLGKQTRPHQDIDLAVSWGDKNRIIRFMLDADWRVLEALGGGRVRELTGVPDGRPARRSLFCLARNNTSCRLRPIGDGLYGFSLLTDEQTEFDYVDFLFSERDGLDFCCGRTGSIRRSIDKAVLNLDDIPVLAPEIVLLYKFGERCPDRSGAGKHDADFAAAFPSLGSEERSWLKSALQTEYEDRHEWLRLIGACDGT